VGHVGILLKDPYFIHASSSKGVMVSSLDAEYWSKYFVSGGKL
jgi:cell wall-associated NlpC family hydrolase